MIQDANWVFADALAMPSNTTGIPTGYGDFDGYIDWTASLWRDWINTPIPLWIVCTCNTVPTGTSFNILFYQHTTSTITSGDLLWTGPDIVVADLSADPFDPGHWICCVPLMTIMAAAQAMGSGTHLRYCGPVMNSTGVNTDGAVDIWLHQGANPPIPVTQPAIRPEDASNIVMPT